MAYCLVYNHGLAWMGLLKCRNRCTIHRCWSEAAWYRGHMCTYYVTHITIKKGGSNGIAHPIHCKKKMVVLTRLWSPELHLSASPVVVGTSCFEVGQLKCRVGLWSSLAHAEKKNSLSFSKGVRRCISVSVLTWALPVLIHKDPMRAIISDILRIDLLGHTDSKKKNILAPQLCIWERVQNTTTSICILECFQKTTPF